MKKYVNGNYMVTLYPNGTKIRNTVDSEFKPNRPETIDVCISKYCKNGCKFCYLGASVNGKHGNLDLKVFSNLPKYIELAINYAEHPDLQEFLYFMRDRDVIVNMTINIVDLNDEEVIRKLKHWSFLGLITGLGISVSTDYSQYHGLIKLLNSERYFKGNIVIHAIAGITSLGTLRQMYNHRLKLLILGYKQKGFGIDFYNNAKKIVESNTVDFSKQVLKQGMMEVFKGFDIVSFDNLALEQLDVKSLVSKETWELHYMGSDGKFSMYIDTVDETYAKSSMETKTYPIGNKLINEIFMDIRGDINGDNK